MTAPADPAPPSRAAALRELAVLCLRLGATSFGGPAAHIALLEDEVVRRRRWLTRAEFLDLLGATNLIPGPNSTEMVMHVGSRRAGFPGLVVAGACFIVPAALATAALAFAYVRWGSRPEAASLLYGLKPVIIAVVVQALAGLGRTALSRPESWLLCAAALAASLGGAPELPILFASGLIMIVYKSITTHTQTGSGSPPALITLLAPGALPPGALAPVAATAAAAAIVPFGLAPLFLVFLKIGAVLYGSGYVLLAFLRTEFVSQRGWLTEAQLLDAVAAGQVTPGPVFTTATFIGWLLGGPAGAALATLGIFLPAFVFVALSGPFISRLRNSKIASAFLDGVNLASLALMAAVTLQLARAAVVDLPTLFLALAGAILLVRYRPNATWLIAAGAAIGLLAKLFRG